MGGRETVADMAMADMVVAEMAIADMAMAAAPTPS
jgi:hypothetical protein